MKDNIKWFSKIPRPLMPHPLLLEGKGINKSSEYTRKQSPAATANIK